MQHTVCLDSGTQISSSQCQNKKHDTKNEKWHQTEEVSVNHCLNLTLKECEKCIS